MLYIPMDGSFGIEKVVNARTAKQASDIPVNTYEGAEQVKKSYVANLEETVRIISTKEMRKHFWLFYLNTKPCESNQG